VSDARTGSDPGVAGLVYLVGAGPGDPGLLTARALELIARADVILHDRLIPAAALDGARADAELLYVGKEGGGTAVPQEQTEALMVDRARAGRMVVRLKGGDPFVFGRGGEEAQTLRAAGVDFEVVPGITAGVAAPAYAGIPVTHRDHASAVAFVTGHEHPAKPGSALDWPALARFPGTLVFYMGVKRLPEIARQLMAEGRDGEEPAAIVQEGTLPTQRTVTATLATIADRAAAEGIRAPAITVVGPAAGAREELQWLERRPLHGVSVAVTRARAQASGLAARLRELGAEVILAPSIYIEVDGHRLPVLDESPGSFGHLIAHSANAVDEFFDLLRRSDMDARHLNGVTVAVVGEATADAMRAHGIEPDIVSEKAVSESLAEALRGVPIDRALILRGAQSRDVVADELRARGVDTRLLTLYETVAAPLSPEQLADAERADYITFTSSSTVRFFFGAGVDPAGPRSWRAVSIGPATSKTLRDHGIEPDVEARTHNVDGLIDALLADVQRVP
jgi:uroporphyrinogen III methyltransferase/synthase